MLAKDALEKAKSVQDAEFWKERAEWLEHIDRAARVGLKYCKRNDHINTNVKVALEFMGYKVNVTRSDYTSVDWS